MVISKYEAVSERVMELVRPHADVLEQTGIDEAFLDLTRASGGDYSAAATLAKEIKGSILREERLTCSIGVGRSKAVAKLGSDLSKPDGLKVVPPAETATFMGPLEVGRLYGVGPKTAKALEGLGIRTVEELARADVSVLTDSFGRKLGVYLRDAAGGLDSEPVRGDLAPTQLSRVITLKEDTTDAEEAMAQLGPALADLAARVSAQKTTFRTLAAIAILTDLSTKTRSRTFDTPVNDLAAVRDVLEELFSQLSETVDREFRRVGVRVSDLSSGQDQKSLGEFMAPW